MTNRLRTAILPVALLLLSLSAASLGTLSASAQTSSAGGLPAYTTPSAQRFDLKGSITIGPQVTQLSGTGATAKDRFMLDMTIMPAGTPVPLVFNQVQVGSMYYFKLTGNPQWQSIDLSTTPGNTPDIQSNIPGFNGFNPNGGQRTFEATGPAQQVGKETINGASTTEYQAGVDVAKLFSSIGVPAQQAAAVAAVSKMTAYVWIGDTDNYMYQTRIVLNTKAANPAGGFVDVVVDFTNTYHDFGADVTIKAPDNSVPYAPGGGTSQPSSSPTAATSGSSQGSSTGNTPGMPRTGAAGSLPVTALGMLALLCVALGLAARRARRSTR